jgi:hypothetical protein
LAAGNGSAAAIGWRLAAVGLMLSAIGQAGVAGICRLLLARLLLMKEVLLLVTLHTICSSALIPHHLE